MVPSTGSKLSSEYMYFSGYFLDFWAVRNENSEQGKKLRQEVTQEDVRCKDRQCSSEPGKKGKENLSSITSKFQLADDYCARNRIP